MVGTHVGAKTLEGKLIQALGKVSKPLSGLLEYKQNTRYRQKTTMIITRLFFMKDFWCVGGAACPLIRNEWVK